MVVDICWTDLCRPSLTKLNKYCIDQKMKLAIVLITYNQEEFIREALDGIRLQTRQPNEVVIADDGSPDNTAEIIKAYVKEYGLEERWRLLMSPYNRGINENLQNAIDHTTSDIILPIAGDDVALKNRVETVGRIFSENLNTFHIVTSAYIIDETGKNIGVVNHNNKIFNNPLAAIKNGLPNTSSCGLAFRREIIDIFGKLPLDIPNEDGQLLFRGIIYGGLFASSEKTIKYRIHNKSASSWLRNFLSNDAYFNRFIKDLDGWSKNMYYWSVAISKTNIKNKEVLIHLAEKKASFYIKLREIQSLRASKRIRLFFEYKSIICKREMVYILFGKCGFIFWRKIRAVIGRK